MSVFGFCSRNNFANARYLIGLLICLLLAACGAGTSEKMLEKFSTPEDRARAQGYIDQLRAHDFAALEKAADPDVRTTDLHDTLVKMAGLLPPQAPRSARLVGATRQIVFSDTADQTTTVSTTFELDYGGQWRLVQVVVKTVGHAPPVLAGLRVVTLPQSVEQLNRFTLTGKGASQYAVLLGAVAALLLTLGALIVCIRTRMPRRKWLWLLFIVTGFGQASVNWTSGDWSLNPFYVQLLSAGAAAAPFSPWVVSCAVPVGALVFLFYKWPRLRHARAVAREDTPAPAQTDI